jgi:predicted PurR-regulated permease PerM
MTETKQAQVRDHSLQQRAGRSRSEVAVLALTVMASGVLLYFCQEALIPVALALLFSLILSTAVEALHRRGLPRGVSAFIMLVLFFAAIGAAVDAVWDPAQQWFKSAPKTLQGIERKLGPLQTTLQRFESLIDRAGSLGASKTSAAPPAGGTAPAAATPAPKSGPGVMQEASSVLDTTRTALADIVAIVVLTLFLLAGGPPMLARMAAAFSSQSEAARLQDIIEAIRAEVGRYYATTALINIGLGTATAIVTMSLGMPSPLLWGVIAAVLNFIPYVGSAVTLTVLTLVAFVTFDHAGRVVAVAACYVALSTIEGQVVQPLLVGRRLDLNPLIVFLALWFAGWGWGIAGITIAIPALVASKVAAEHSESGAAWASFLSPSDSDKSKVRTRVQKARAAMQSRNRSMVKPGTQELK